MSTPIVGAGLFRAVMDAAGGRCHCTGQCGQSHRRTEGRCGRLHDGYAATRVGTVRLIAAPADPTIGDLAAAALPAAELRAWCPGCFTAARRTAQCAVTHIPSTDQCSLFDF
ncbi:hypothetical protein GA0115240_137823 [Streptomyces sp. DvalAA-14]|uniref:hypothetical protein n=1 Tax=unclassified Streptomyces TaxID=2593676 RepID=UPI00081AFEF6|nr:MULTISPECIES: hypothetical protein [unclassified Streptomyces]MYS22060.1 hypothetical protein [Streptomyces sp. SID4948]SCE07691.1 hypothetical protein GA0115240_137823 [Streptomyces sp. DvalAA-14]